MTELLRSEVPKYDDEIQAHEINDSLEQAKALLDDPTVSREALIAAAHIAMGMPSQLSVDGGEPRGQALNGQLSDQLVRMGSSR